MCKRIARRAHELGVSPRELSRDELAALCTVTISRFYRDRAVFDCLGARVLPALAEAALARGATALDCWSAGCASGEEPYTLTIQWQAALAPRFPTLEPRVLGTDIDATLLERAQSACYNASSLKELPASWRSQAFERRARLFCLREDYRRAVEFERRDLLAEPRERRFDLIVCRNLAFTYFGPDLARAALQLMVRRLRPRGALVIGVHEQLPDNAGQLAPWPGCRAIYQKAA